MENPVEIDFQGEIPIHGLREKIVENLSQLEDRFGRIIGLPCRPEGAQQPSSAGFL